MTELRISNRIAYWDNAKGILICLVVFGHYLYSYNVVLSAHLLVSCIYFFHMPAFVLISGFFSKDENTAAARSIVRLAAAYFIFNTVMMIYSVIFKNAALSLIEPYNSYWYLAALIIWRLTIRKVTKIRGVVWISVVTALLIGFWSEISNAFALARVICFYPFFLVGYKLSTEKIDAFMNNRKRVDYLKGILLLVVSIGLAFYAALTFYPSAEIYLMYSYASPGFLLVRIIIFVIAAMMIICLAYLTPSNPIPFISKWGKNSLAIYVLHRIITLNFELVFPIENYTAWYILYAVLLSAATLFVLGLDSVTYALNSLLRIIADMICDTAGRINERRKDSFRSVIIFLLILILAFPALMTMSGASDTIPEETSGVIYPVISDQQVKDIQNAVSLAFVGDMILLQDQVRDAYSPKTGEYDFSEVFAYASRYLSDADVAIGVLEGPAAGENQGYSTSNYADSLPLSLNFPDSFVDAVKDAGIDFVTTANNHLLDKGEEGALRTLAVLDAAGMEHTGSYRNAKEKDTVKIIEAEGLRIAVLSYTYGCNNYDTDYFMNENQDITSILVEETSMYFESVKKSVLSDLERARKTGADLIVVLPHMGTQFSHETDSFQETWDSIFIEAGADLILGDHSHAVQPVEFRTITEDDGTQRQALIVNCAGNFVNSYTEMDGDATAIAEVYLDSTTGDIICAAVIPMWTQSLIGGMYRALPIYDIMTDEDLQKQISTHDMDRIAEVQSTVTSVMLGTDVLLDQASERYYLFPAGYVRQPAEPMEITDQMKETELFKLISRSDTVCFVGDSVTAGKKNGGYGWFEPLMASFPAVTVINEAWDSATTRTLLSNAQEILSSGADTYIVAIGTNDVRYRDKKICAMDPESYIVNISLLTGQILEVYPDADFVFISPWHALDNDPYTAVPVEERDALLAEYGRALETYCETNDYLFIDPNPLIDKVLLQNVTSDYLIDHIHPNARKGIVLYSQAVMESSAK